MRYAVRLVLIGALLATGCISAEDKAIISTGAAVGQGNLNDWATLSDAQRMTAHANLVASYCVLDHDINKRDLPAWVAAVVSAGN